MAITGTKLFASGDVLTASDTNQYLMRGVKVFASTAIRDAAYGGAGEPTLEEGETCYITATDKVQTYNGSSWVDIGPYSEPTYATATGGTESNITAGGVAYKLHTFNSSANLTISAAGYVDVLLVGAGGQGGGSGVSQGGGGGGGDLFFAYRQYLLAGTYAVTVGAGNTTNGRQGGASKFASSESGIVLFIAYGGGSGNYGGGWNTYGGSAGGGGVYGGAQGGGYVHWGFHGNAGGTAPNGSEAGGGGGAGTAASGKTGGNGLDVSAWLGQVASTTIRGGGGAGTSGTAGTGGGAANTGGGGNATSGNNAGYSGVVYVRTKQ
jgi:hypothetical protein